MLTQSHTQFHNLLTYVTISISQLTELCDCE